MGAGASVPSKGPWALAAKGNSAALQHYCTDGGDPNVVCETRQCTPLQVAARIDSVECIEVLLRAGADVNLTTAHGTALHAAASRCCHRSVHLLLHRGADPLLRDATGRTPADLAEAVGYYNLAHELRARESTAWGTSAGSAVQPAALGRLSPLHANGGVPHAAGQGVLLPQQRPQQQQQQQQPVLAGQPLAAGSWKQLPGQPPAPTFMAHPAPQAPMQQYLPAGQLGHSVFPVATTGQPAAQLHQLHQLLQLNQLQQQALWPAQQQPGQQQQQPGQQQQHALWPAQQQPGQQQQQPGQQPQQSMPNPAASATQPPARGLYPAIYGTSALSQPGGAAAAAPAAHVNAAGLANGPAGKLAGSTGGPAGFQLAGDPASAPPASAPGLAAMGNQQHAAGLQAAGPQAAASALPAVPAPARPPADAPTAPPASCSLLERMQGRALPGTQPLPAQLGRPQLPGSGSPRAAAAAGQAAPGATPFAAAAAAAPVQASPAKTPLAAALAAAREPSAALPAAAPTRVPAPATAASPLQAALAAAAEPAPPAVQHPHGGLPTDGAPPRGEAGAELDALPEELELLAFSELDDPCMGSTEGRSADEHSGPSPELLEDPVLTWVASQRRGMLYQEPQQEPRQPPRPQQAQQEAARPLPQQAQQRELPQWERELQGQREQQAAQQAAQQAPPQPAQAQQRGLRGQPSSVSELAPASSARTARVNSLPDISPWEIEFEDLQMQRTIGEGSFGKVYVAKWNETLVAVKVLVDVEEAQKAAAPDAVWRLSDPIMRNLQKECQMMAAMRHPNIVQFMGVTSCPPAMITEYCSKGSLTDVLQGARKSPHKAAQLTWPRRLHMLLDAAKGMLYLHRRSPPIVHRDLKSPNLLVDATWHAKVGDFNLSKILEDIGDTTKSASIQNMNPRWLAPEIVLGGSATPASDVYSFGIVMWEMMTWKLPFGGHNPWTVLNLLMAGKRPTSDPRDPLPGPPFARLPAYQDLMHRCWDQAPERRPDFSEVIRRLRELLEHTVQQPVAR